MAPSAATAATATTATAAAATSAATATVLASHPDEAVSLPARSEKRSLGYGHVFSAAVGQGGAPRGQHPSSLAPTAALHRSSVRISTRLPRDSSCEQARCEGLQSSVALTCLMPRDAPPRTPAPLPLTGCAASSASPELDATGPDRQHCIVSTLPSKNKN